MHVGAAAPLELLALEALELAAPLEPVLEEVTPGPLPEVLLVLDEPVAAPPPDELTFPLDVVPAPPLLDVSCAVWAELHDTA
jgi:hypothetical protein